MHCRWGGDTVSEDELRMRGERQRGRACWNAIFEQNKL